MAEVTLVAMDRLDKPFANVVLSLRESKVLVHELGKLPKGVLYNLFDKLDDLLEEKGKSIDI